MPQIYSSWLVYSKWKVNYCRLLLPNVYSSYWVYSKWKKNFCCFILTQIHSSWWLYSKWMVNYRRLLLIKANICAMNSEDSFQTCATILSDYQIYDMVYLKYLVGQALFNIQLTKPLKRDRFLILLLRSQINKSSI